MVWPVAGPAPLLRCAPIIVIPRLKNLWVPPVSWRYGRPGNLIGKPQCVNGLPRRSAKVGSPAFSVHVLIAPNAPKHGRA